MRFVLCSAVLALLVIGTSATIACPVDVTSPSPNADLKIDASGDAFTQFLGSADVLPSGGAILVTDSHDEPASNSLSPSSGGIRPAVAPALIPLPSAVWSGFVALGALGMYAIVCKLRGRPFASLH